MTPSTTPIHEIAELEALIGTWDSEGYVITTDDAPPIRISGTDQYEWVCGGRFLLHRVDVRVGEEKVEAIELIGGSDGLEKGYPMRSFDNQGAFSVMHASRRDDGGWMFCGETARARLEIAGDGSTMKAHWEELRSAGWHPWMEMEFRRR